MKDNGPALLAGRYESGNQQILNNIKEGHAHRHARRLHQGLPRLGVTIHGTFILGLPGETRETIAETVKFATEINPHTVQVSLPRPIPARSCIKQAVENGWSYEAHAEADRRAGRCRSRAALPAFCRTLEIFDSVETFYKRFYFRIPRSPRWSARWCAAPR